MMNGKLILVQVINDNLKLDFSTTSYMLGHITTKGFDTKGEYDNEDIIDISSKNITLFLRHVAYGHTTNEDPHRFH